MPKRNQITCMVWDAAATNHTTSKEPKQGCSGVLTSRGEEGKG